MRIWFKMMKNNHLLRDTTITDESDETRTHKVFQAPCQDALYAGFLYRAD